MVAPYSLEPGDIVTWPLSVGSFRYRVLAGGWDAERVKIANVVYTDEEIEGGHGIMLIRWSELVPVTLNPRGRPTERLKAALSDLRSLAVPTRFERPDPV